MLSPRIKVVKENKGQISFVIDQSIEKWKMMLLLGWLLGWTYCGGVFLYYFFQAPANSDRLFFGISSALWFFFFVRIGKVYLWRVMGKEVIQVSAEGLILQNAFGSRGKKEQFELGKIQQLGVVNKDNTNILHTLDDSFWVMGGERIGFIHKGDKIRLGKQLNTKETELLLMSLDSAIKGFKKG